MKNRSVRQDPFLNRIREILTGSSGDIRTLVFNEVQSYSRDVQGYESTSDLFIKLCELMVDCQSSGIPEDAFKLIIASLVYECSGSQPATDEELRVMTGMDEADFVKAKEYFMNKECIQLMMSKPKGARGRPRKSGSSPMAFKR